MNFKQSRDRARAGSPRPRRLFLAGVACAAAALANGIVVAAATKNQIAVFRPSTGEWFVRHDDGSATPIAFGGAGDMPVPADYLGAGSLQLTVFRPSNAHWFIRKDDGSAVEVAWGGLGDMPVP